MKNRKTVIVAFLLAAVMLLGIGYAALTDTLVILGNAHIDLDTTSRLFDEKVYFSDAEATSSTGSGATEDVVSYNMDDATYTANRLATIGEYSKFTFTITNDSNADADITIAATKLSGVDNPSNSNTEFFKVEYEYPDGNTIAKNGGTIDVIVTVTVLKVPTSATSGTFGIELTATAAE